MHSPHCCRQAHLRHRLPGLLGAASLALASSVTAPTSFRGVAACTPTSWRGSTGSTLHGSRGSMSFWQMKWVLARPSSPLLSWQHSSMLLLHQPYATGFESLLVKASLSLEAPTVQATTIYDNMCPEYTVLQNTTAACSVCTMTCAHNARCCRAQLQYDLEVATVNMVGVAAALQDLRDL